MIRVLHYGVSPNKGGIETFILDHARRLVGDDFQFDFVYNDVGRPFVYAELNAAGSRFFGLTPRRRSPMKNRSELEKVLSENAFDVVHCHMNTLSYVAPIRAALRHNVPILVHSHNAGVSTSRATRQLHMLNKRLLPWEEINRLAVSEAAGQWLFGRRAKFDVLHNGIDVEKFTFNPNDRQRIRGQLSLSADDYVIGHVGTFLHAKNHRFLLRVHKEVLKVMPAAILLLVGDGPLQRDTRQEADRMGMASAVRFLGTRHDVSAVLSAMDALAFPSLHEGLPLTVLEAQASGLPCYISSAITPEVVVTETCVRLPLSAGPVVWAQRVVMTRTLGARGRGAAAVAAAGFEAATSSTRLADLYRQAVRNWG